MYLLRLICHQQKYHTLDLTVEFGDLEVDLVTMSAKSDHVWPSMHT